MFKACRLGFDLSSYVVLAVFSQGLLSAQFIVHLNQKTNRAFDDYAAKVEDEMDQRWQGKRSYFWIREHPQAAAAVQKGDLVVEPGTDDGIVPVPEGLIHDWVGAMYLLGAKLPQVLAFLQNFDEHENYFSQVIKSRTLDRSGETIRGYWRLQENQVWSVVLDVNQVAQYEKTGSDRWHCRAVTTRVSEVDGAGGSHEKIHPPGEGHGYMWRLDAYWTLEQTPQGVYAECRTISLSRDVPSAVRWAVKPILQTFPRESLLSTLRGVRKAISDGK
jgi:hypothetical protein